MDRVSGSVITKRQWQVGEQAHRSFLSVSRRVTVACESAHNWIGALERGLRVVSMEFDELVFGGNFAAAIRRPDVSCASDVNQHWFCSLDFKSVG
ncbi:unnamed protein product [Danaus chrysippus]|uniref:(African queen) hypothetical protein n=1 Tax=Danaus chrysippus TaxID=151541 RepID=A0A8J2QDJ3_9NEOP|nr:unnamed protein product [Danaus chrysippus]